MFRIQGQGRGSTSYVYHTFLKNAITLYAEPTVKHIMSTSIICTSHCNRNNTMAYISPKFFSNVIMAITILKCQIKLVNKPQSFKLFEICAVQSTTLSININWYELLQGFFTLTTFNAMLKGGKITMKSRSFHLSPPNFT